MNPIVRRELLDWMRTRRAVAVQGGLALAAAALVLVRWPSEGVGDLSGATATQVLRVFGYGLLACLVLMLPAFSATSVVRERVRGTLALLLNSPMSVPAIYAGKLGGVLGFTTLLLLVTLPGAAACYALGGSTVSGGVWLVYAVLAAAAVQIATLGLFVSSRQTGIDSALRTTYAAVLALYTLPLVPHLLLPRDTPAVDWLANVSPVPAMMEAVGHGGVGLLGSDQPGGNVVRYLIVAAVFSVAAAVWTTAGLARNPLDRARPAGVMTQDRSLGGRLLRRAMFLVDPQRRTRGIAWWVNPVMAKEFRTRKFGRSHWVLRLLAGTAVVSLGLSCLAMVGAVGLGIEVIAGSLVLLQAVLLLLFAPSLSAGLISSEREGGGWPLLLTTPLSPWAILRGKLLSVVWPVLLLSAATLPGYVVMMSVKPELTPQVYRVLICQGVTAGFAVLVGATASSLFRSTAAATATTFLAMAAVCVAPMLVWLAEDAPFGRRTVEAVLSINPVAAALSAAEFPGFTGYELTPLNWWIMGGVCGLLFVVLVARTWRLSRPA